MNISDNNTEHFDPEEAYRTFVRQLSNWSDGGELPELAGQDLRFVLELQKQKLQLLGLDMKYEFPRTSSDRISVGGLSLSDRIFTNRFMCGYMSMTRSIGRTKDQLNNRTADIGLIAVIQELKEGTQPNDNIVLCCPHCGAPSTLGELQSGCKYCGTQFIMSELYPRVMNYFINECYDSEKNRIKNKRDLTFLITACSLPMTIIGIIINLFGGQGRNIIENVIFGLLGGIFSGAMLGGIIFLFKKLFEVLGVLGKGLRGGGYTILTLFYANKIKKHDPEFSSEYFRDKIMSLFRMAVYSKDATELAYCKCKCPEKAADIIDAQLFNFSINTCEIKNNVCDMYVTLYLDCLHYRDEKIISKSDKYIMRIRKKIKAPTELGFSFSAVSCPSCGASFDAHKVKACPYCKNEYLHEDHDWVIVNII